MNKHVINCHIYYDFSNWNWALSIEDDGTVFEHAKTWFISHVKAMEYVYKLAQEGFAINLLEFPDQNYYSSDIPEEIHKDIINLGLNPKTFPEHFTYE